MSEVDPGHPIYEIPTKGQVEVYSTTDDGGVLAEIDEDPQTGEPIFAYALESGSHAVFLLPDEGPDHIRVLHIESENEGEMGSVMDHVVKTFGEDLVIFFNVVNMDLLKKLQNPSTKTVNIQDEKVIVAECEWDLNR